MSYVATGRALGAGEASLVDQAIAALPVCYSIELDTCLNGGPGAKADNCALFNAAYNADYDKMQASVEKLPFCACTPGSAPAGLGLKGVAIAGVVGLGVGMLVGKKLK